jgi:hypothetical protein
LPACVVTDDSQMPWSAIQRCAAAMRARPIPRPRESSWTEINPMVPDGGWAEMVDTPSARPSADRAMKTASAISCRVLRSIQVRYKASGRGGPTLWRTCSKRCSRPSLRAACLGGLDRLLFRSDGTVSVGLIQPSIESVRRDHLNTISGRRACPADPLRMVSARSRLLSLRRRRRC